MRLIVVVRLGIRICVIVVLGPCFAVVRCLMVVERVHGLLGALVRFNPRLRVGRGIADSMVW